MAYPRYIANGAMKIVKANGVGGSMRTTDILVLKMHLMLFYLN